MPAFPHTFQGQAYQQLRQRIPKSMHSRIVLHSEGQAWKSLTFLAAHRLYHRLPSLSVRQNKRDRKSTPVSRAKRDFNRAAMRERSKWERETVSNTPDRGFSSSTAPSWGGSNARAGGTYAVATLIVAWAGLRSTPPEAERRKGAWFWKDGGARDDDRDVGFSVINRWEAIGSYTLLLLVRVFPPLAYFGRSITAVFELFAFRLSWEWLKIIHQPYKSADASLRGLAQAHHHPHLRNDSCFQKTPSAPGVLRPGFGWADISYKSSCNLVSQPSTDEGLFRAAVMVNPAENDSLDREDLDAKWPELRAL